MPQATKDKFFKVGLSSRDKAENTTMIARSISDAETAAREAKTAKLKKLRLAQEAAANAAAPPATDAKPKARSKPAKSPAARPGK